ncbi:hypothetical protein PIB30_055997 [Stylosanthes scabra]|uniref:Uncharacterized protein n=1 Tax=Stylosanthes scabra TaxID=79078 RepID=A0ABU6YLP4_9FABA|nr:hypothetical protein [Stylosanthes scabra]
MQESFYFEELVNPILVRKTFDYRMGRIVQQMLRKVRLGNEESTGWITPALKREVRNKFATDEGFQRRSATNKVNRASAKGGSLHCGGSTTIPSTQERMAKELNREPTLAEVFKQTHTRKRNKEEWVDEWSARLNDVFITELDTRTQATQQSAHEGNDSNSPVVVDPDEVWRDVAPTFLGPYAPILCSDLLEGRVSLLCLSTPWKSFARKSTAELKMNATVEQAREEMVREREELVREREEYRKMREKMAAYYASMRASRSGVGSTTVTAPTAQHDGDGGQEEVEDDADDYQDP